MSSMPVPNESESIPASRLEQTVPGCSALGVFPLTWSSILGVVCPEEGPVEGRLFRENLDSFIERRDRDRGGFVPPPEPSPESVTSLAGCSCSSPFSVSFS